MTGDNRANLSWAAANRHEKETPFLRKGQVYHILSYTVKHTCMIYIYLLIVINSLCYICNVYVYSMVIGLIILLLHKIDDMTNT